jgi:hypothetical protein
MEKIKTIIFFLTPILFLSALLAWPLSSDSRFELSTTPMITTAQTDVDRSDQAPSSDTGTFGNLPKSARVFLLLAGTGIVGLVRINRNKK